MYSMFPMVEKSYRARVSSDIERELRFLGQSRVDALTSPFDMTFVKERPGLQLYELCEKEFYTLKGVTSVNAPLADVMQLLKMDSTSAMREVMGELFGTLFLDGVMLHKGASSSTRTHESLSVNWMALQASKPNLPHRDYVFLRYADVFEKTAEHGSLYGANGSGLYMGASIWESIELDGCEPLPASQNVVRLKLRRCGFVVEETAPEGPLQVSLYLSEGHPGRAAVSTLTRTWMTKLASCVGEVGTAMLARALSSHNLLEKRDFRTDGPHCLACLKVFTMFRRKHHCRLCGDVVCSKCSEIKSLRQNGLNRDVRLCKHCRSANTSSIQSSGSNSLSHSLSHSTSHTNGGAHSVPSFSHSPSHDSMDGGYSSARSAATVSMTVSESHSESARLKTYPMASSTNHNRKNNMGSPVVTTNSSSASDRSIVTKEDGNAAYSEFAAYQHDLVAGGETAAPSPEQLLELSQALTVRENTSFKYALSYSSRQEWPKAPVPPHEAARLAKVRELHLADPGKQFQEMCEYAAAEMGCQMAAICFIGDKSGFLMAKVGLDKREVSRNVLLEAHAIMARDPTVALDASEDLRFVHNPLVADGLVRFFAAFPLITSDGHVVGALSVADPFAREVLPGDKVMFLRNLADVAMRGVEQNTLMSLSVHKTGSNGSSSSLTRLSASAAMQPPPPGMNIAEAQLTMQELLRTAYTTQCQVRMQVNPLTDE